MTTKVTIINHGPDGITVTKKTDSIHTGGTAFIKPGCFYESYVYNTQNLFIEEVKEDGKKESEVL